jgi:hypothetical protein
MIEGGCLCGGVRYELTGQIGQVANCHCNMCRRVHGAAFGTYAELGRSDVKWTQGDALVKRFASSNGVDRLFCKRCGSTLQFLFDLEPDKVYVTLGTMDGDPGVRPEVHIFAGSKAPWHVITDDLPQYDEWTDDFLPGK